jgi:flagellum-specific peptidoglycan hydrolase FlgJ
MITAGKPRWQQLTALVSLSAGGVITGFSFVPGAPNDLAAPAAVPVHLLALKQSAQQSPADDATLRSAIVNVAQYYQRMARHRTPAEMRAIIWQNDSMDGADHGASCAAFASLTLELAAQVVGKHSWATGGTSYPWPLYKWADVRVDRNPASPGIISIRQDAEAHQRWRPLADGYEPLPGDWVMFHGHIEVVTSYAGGVLHTIGGDSLPDFSVNAHEYRGPLAAQGIVGFVDNGDLSGATSRAPAGGDSAAPGRQQGGREHVSHGDQARPGDHAARGDGARGDAASAMAAIPGASPAHAADPPPARQPGDAAIPGPAFGARGDRQAVRHPHEPGRGRSARRNQHLDRVRASRAAHRDMPEAPHGGRRAAAETTAGGGAADGTAAIPGVPPKPRRLSPPSAAVGTSPHHKHNPAPATGPADAAPATAAPADPAPANAAPTDPAPASAAPANAAPLQVSAAERAFIGRVAPGAMAAQRKYGVPASVTIAQAINESGWGRSALAAKDHNLFGIKGTGPSGSDAAPTYEYQNGRPQPRTASFRVYRNTAESIDDHGKLLATSGYYRQSMADRHDPDAFAASLTGVYATDPEYGAKLIHLMRRFDLYRYDNPSSAAAHPGGPSGATAAPPAARTGARATPPAAPTGATATPPAAPAGPAAVPPGAPAAAVSPGQPQAAPAPPARTARPRPSPSATPGPDSESPAPRPQESAPRGHGTPQPPDPAPSTQAASYQRMHAPGQPAPKIASRTARPRKIRYQQGIPPSVRHAFVSVARAPLLRAEPLYQDVASHSGIRWELLAACDWMQCEAQKRYSPVHGEKLGTVNPDGTIYRTKSAALDRCADDLVELAHAVYRIDLTAPGCLSVRDLANAFAAFRWGGLLRLHHTSAMEFPYSVAGLTDEHQNMRWPNIADRNAPDRPGARFRMPFGAVPIVLFLKYPATV